MNIFEYAIKMELDGEKYYSEQAQINKNNSLFVVCNILAEDEKLHAQILEKKMSRSNYELKDSDILNKKKGIFEDATNIEVLGKEKASQLDFYRIATDMEKESIALYEEILHKSTDEKEIEIFKYLIKQEKIHFELLENLSILLNRPEEWVESAEFGVREDY